MTDYGARAHYHGNVAQSYDARRTGSLKWAREQALMTELIGALPRGSTVLDVPIGTARYAEMYAAGGHRVVGADVSRDMLREARGRAPELGLVQADVTKLPFAAGSFDFVVSTRLMNWLPAPVFHAAVQELARVARRGLILGVRGSERVGLRHAPVFVQELAQTPKLVVASAVAAVRTRKDKIPLVIHPQPRIDEAFADAGLAVERAVQVWDGTAFTRTPLHFTPLRLYVLRR